MTPALRQLVWSRAAQCCEYCLVPAAFDRSGFEIDHVIAQSHRGMTVAGNLALACYWCNHYKGTNVAGVDPATRKIIRLFHPRLHKWSKHFAWSGAVLGGRTDIGRTTAITLQINTALRVATRELLIAEGVFPPS